LRNSHKVVELEPVISDFVLDGQLMKKVTKLIFNSITFIFSVESSDSWIRSFVFARSWWFCWRLCCSNGENGFVMSNFFIQFMRLVALWSKILVALL